MITWKEFTEADPELASLGKRQIFQFGVGLAFLATIRKDGGPRVHPLCPVLKDDHLYVFISPESPKKWDLLRDGRYALQAFPPPKEESEEFYLAGKAALMKDADLWRAVAAATKSVVKEGEALFELYIERAMYTGWENWGTPEIRPVHRKWIESRQPD